MADQYDSRSRDYNEGPMWEAFGLGRASYFVAPRRALHSMPREWQERMIALMNEAYTALGSDAFPEYTVRRVDDRGRFIADDLRDYRHTGPLPLAKDNANA